MSDEFSTVSAFSDLLSTVTQLGEVLRQQGWTVSCAESCTGGGIAYVLTSVAGSSDWFNQSWVTYSNQAKQQRLGVTPSTLNHHGAVSQQTVEQMVNGVVENSGAEVGVSVSGIAGPGGGTKEKPVGTVWFGFSIGGQLYSRCCQFDGDRLSVREQAIHFAIDFLYQRLVAE
ncbi:CinA family protein [Alteromonas sp. C1M14]|uniref:CinA family protein n=1 Tax=Alteromonas sp. C1M14 TaxID=2841567 RepID=UPI001C09C2A0|nr:CinA family protein [Alteromonas sp. C1M14]MBU2977811.1 CinA family protein [Alteromonas sp. C1M14]